MSLLTVLLGHKCKVRLIPRCESVTRRCRGYGYGAYCSQHSDCNPELFCKSSMCIPVLPLRAECDSDISCGPGSFCYFTSPRDPYGRCNPYIGLRNGLPASFSFDKVNCNTSAHTGDVEEPHLRCSSYYADSEGICRESFLSPSKGKECQTNQDCMNSQQQPHTCKCALDGSKKKYCDIGPDDSEWVQAREMFKKYLASVVYCHSARKLQECGHSEDYNAW